MVSVENEIFPLRKYNKFHSVVVLCWTLLLYMFRALFIVLYSLSAMSYWIGMFSARIFFRASSFLLLFLFSSILCVCLCASAEHIRSSASFALCDSSRFSFLLAIIFCTRPNGAFSYFVFSCSCFCLSLRIDTFYLFAIVFPFLCFLSFSLSYCIYGVTAVPIFHQKRKKNILCNRMAMAIPIIKNKANENENKRSTYRAERTRRSTLQQN